MPLGAAFPLSVKEKKLGRMLRTLRRSRRTLLLIIVVVAITIISQTSVALWLSRSANLMIPSAGTIHAIRVEVSGGDIETIDGVTSINWGTLQTGDSKSKSINLRSISNAPTTLVLSVDNWEPEGLEPYMLVSWNYTGKQIAPNEEIPVRISLNASSSADFFGYLITNQVTSFSCSLLIQAVES